MYRCAVIMFLPTLAAAAVLLYMSSVLDCMQFHTHCCALYSPPDLCAVFHILGTSRYHFVPVWLDHHHPCLPGHLPCSLLQLPVPRFPQQVGRWRTRLASSSLPAFTVWRIALKLFYDHYVFSVCRLTSFYETAVPDLEKAVRKRNFDDKRWVSAEGVWYSNKDCPFHIAGVVLN